MELAAGAYGDYLVSLEYGGKVLVEQPWDVGRPWGVTLFWVLLCVVVAVGLFRAGMAVVGRIRPPAPAAAPRPVAAGPRPALVQAGDRPGRTRQGGGMTYDEGPPVRSAPGGPSSRGLRVSGCCP
ncbi:hypothetical protein GCM10020000_48940 [Streptomyces olivoverticillatus]